MFNVYLQTLQSHFRNMDGGWTYVFNDYWELNLTMHFHDEIILKSPGGLWDYEDMFRKYNSMLIYNSTHASSNPD